MVTRERGSGAAGDELALEDVEVLAARAAPGRDGAAPQVAATLRVTVARPSTSPRRARSPARSGSFRARRATTGLPAAPSSRSAGGRDADLDELAAALRERLLAEAAGEGPG